jgi:hypothetical protein
MSGELRPPHPRPGQPTMQCPIAGNATIKCPGNSTWLCPVNEKACVDNQIVAAKSEIESDFQTLTFGVGKVQTEPGGINGLLRDLYAPAMEDMIRNMQRPLWVGSPIGPLVRKPWHKRARNKARNLVMRRVNKVGYWAHRKTDRWCDCDY